MQVIEIFRSIQGEGPRQGSPCTFLRLAGCNLRCRWCDTPYSWGSGEEMGTEEVLAAIRRPGGRYICVTGGEPLLQAEELLTLVKELAREGKGIEIETNGTLDFSRFQGLASICMDVKCPSSGEESDLELLQFITERDSVKFVVADMKDMEYAEHVIEGSNIRGEIFISPVHGVDVTEMLNLIVREDLPVRLQLQMHKLLGVR